MLRMVLVSAVFALWTLAGLRSVVVAGCMLTWNDIFRPTAWARYHGILARHIFPSHDLCWAVLGFAAFFTRWKKRWNTSASVILFLLIWTWICTFAGVDPANSETKAIEALKYIVPILIVSVAAVDRRNQHWYLYTLALSVGIHLAWAGFHAGVLQQDAVTSMSIRAGQMTDRNDFLVAGTGCLPMLCYIGWYHEGRLQRWVRMAGKVMVMFALLAFVFAKSRGAIVGLAGLVIFYSFFTGRAVKRIALIGILMLLALPFVPDFVWDRMSTIEMEGPQTERSAKVRLDNMLVAVKITAQNPVFGVGPRNFAYESSKVLAHGADPHSIWLKCSAEYGLTMLIVFVSLFVWQVRRLRRIARWARERGDRQTEGIATAMCCALVGFLASGTFTSQFMSEYLWAIFGLNGAIIASETIRMNETQEDGADDADAAAPEVQPGTAQPLAGRA